MATAASWWHYAIKSEMRSRRKLLTCGVDYCIEKRALDQAKR